MSEVTVADGIAREKKPALAGILSLLCCGAGQLYNGDFIKAGFMFFGCVIGGVLLGIVAWLLVVPLIIYSIVDAWSCAEKINASAAKIHEQKQIEADEAAKIVASTVSAQEFVGQLEKLHRLFSSNLLNAEEYTERKKQVLVQLHTRTPREPAEDFLAALIPLVKSEALSAEETAQIKALIL